MKVLIALCALAVAVNGVSAALMPLRPLDELDSRITNGNVAAPGQFPYQVGLSMMFGLSRSWCGGTLISDRWIITAAHCTVGADGATVYLGATDIQNENEEGQQRIDVSTADIIVHEGWNPSTLANDIALIKLPVSVTFSEFIQPATLPKKSGSYATFVGFGVWASGWGRDSDSSTSVSQVLRYIEMPIIAKSSCNIYYVGMISDSMICISGKEGKSTCQGDNGGPLVYKDGDVNYLIGSTSFGIEQGCEKGWPGVFTRITSYLDWIEAKSGVVNK